MVRVTFIIPIYNAEKYLEKCLQSIKNQVITDFEVIMIDDGSTDSSVEICKRFQSADNRFHLVRQENSGPSCARNKGIEIANGEWISFIDADDWIEENYLSLIEDGTGTDLIFFGFKELNESKFTVKQIQTNGELVSSNIDCSLSKLFKSESQFFGFTWNKLYRRSIINNNRLRFNENLIIKEDEEFCIRYNKYVSSLYISSKTPYIYRILPLSLSHNSNRFNDYDRLSDVIEIDLQNYPFPYLKRVIKERLYFYRFDALTEARDSDEYYDYIIKWDEYYRRNRRDIKLKSNLKFVHWMPTILLKFQVMNFLRPFKTK